MNIKRWHCSSNENNNLKQQFTVNNQNTKDDLKILWRILSSNLDNYFSSIITWLGNQCMDLNWHDRSMLFNKLWSLSAICFSIRTGPFNPHLPCGISFLRTRDYRMLGVEISQHRCTTIQGIIQGVVVRQGSWVFVYTRHRIWRWFVLEALVRQARGWVLREDDDRKTQSIGCCT